MTRPLMTVASMPIWSAATRSICLACSATPRKKLPPPSTKAISTCNARRLTISSAIAPSRWGSMPNSRLPASASPESLSRTRLKAGAGAAMRKLAEVFADLVAGEAAYGNIFAELGDFAGHQFSHRHFVILDEALIEEAGLFVKLAELAFDDLFDDLRRLAAVLHLGAEDLLLLLAAQIARRGGRDVHGQIVQEGLELGRARHEVGFTGELDEDADLAAGVDVSADGALGGGARGLLGGGGDALLAQPDLGLRQIALVFGQGLLAVHHRGAGAVAELFD